MRRPWARRQPAQAPDSASGENLDNRDPIVLGSQMANARAVEEAHRESRPGVPSPLAGVRYDRSAGEGDLTRFVESPKDDDIRSLVEAWHRSGVENFAMVRDSLAMEDFYTLLTFAQRVTLRAIRSNDAGWAIAGARALPAVDRARVDWRDLSWAAALVAFALRFTGNDVAAVLGEVASVAAAETQETILGFAAEPPTSLTEWGFEIVETRDGTVLARTNYERYEPTSDLVSIALAVADALSDDEYQVDSITIASGLPEVWLRGPHHDRAIAATSRMQACVSVDASPRSASGARMANHMFLVFMAEMQSSEDADTVALAARTNDRDGASLGLSLGAICCIAIARSVVVGIEPIEDLHSIERFASAFTAALDLG